MHESKRSRSKGKMLAGFRRIKPADILIGVFLVGWPFFNLASRYFLSRPGATLESVAVWLIPLRCPINWLTGFMCPTCGLGRSFLLSLNGDFSKAFELHFLGPALAVLIWVSYVGLFAATLLKRSLPQISNVSGYVSGLGSRRYQVFGQLQRPILIGTVLLYALWGLARN